MITLAFGLVLPLSDVEFRTFEDTAVMSWKIPDSDLWAVVLKESVREVNSLETIPISTMHNALNTYHGHFAYSVSSYLPSNTPRPDWLVFE